MVVPDCQGESTDIGRKASIIRQVSSDGVTCKKETTTAREANRGDPTPGVVITKHGNLVVVVVEISSSCAMHMCNLIADIIIQIWSKSRWCVQRNGFEEWCVAEQQQGSKCKARRANNRYHHDATHFEQALDLHDQLEE